MSEYRNDAGVDPAISGYGADAALADDLAAGSTAAMGAAKGSGASESQAPKRPLERAIYTVEGIVSTTLGGKAAQRVREGAEATLGRADAAIEGARYRVDRELAEQPYRTLALAAGVGVVLGLLLARRDRTIIYRPVH